MDGSIQSCESDEALYHESLVHPVLSATLSPKRVLIIGGGEGATLREVVKWPQVELIDMIDWDEEIITLFQTTYPQWAKGAWKDPRAKLHIKDIFEEIVTPPPTPYDCIIIDLFDPEPATMNQWSILLKYLPQWLSATGSMVFYTGTEESDVYQMLQESSLLTTHQLIQYRVSIHSFLGDAMFALFTMDRSFSQSPSSIDPCEIWQAYIEAIVQ
jgi:spermidine synthase